MGNQIEKAKARLRVVPTDYTYSELKGLLKSLGYDELSRGRTSGSRVCFMKGDCKIILHKPHPGDQMKRAAVRQVKEYLEGKGEL